MQHPDPEGVPERGAEGLAEVRPPIGTSDLRQRLARVLGDASDPGVQLRGDPDETVASGAVREGAAPPTAERSAPRYHLIGEVGRGGMGAVLKVFDTELRRHLAMKVVRGGPPRPGDGDAERTAKRVARFLEEAQLTGQLDHPGVVPVHELGVDAEQRLYFTMRLVKGEDLSKVFSKVHAGDPEWSRTRVLGVLLKVCEAMSYAHEKGVVHRDLKPANVMVGRHGAVYVMDWGVARIEGREDSRDVRPRDATAERTLIHTDRGDSKARHHDSPILTMDGDVLGTPHYMPPEQAAGRLQEIGPPSDVYAVGAMLYHLLTGDMPYHAPGDQVSPHTILARVLNGPPPPVQALAPDVPPELASICEKAMARERGARYADMGELSEDLRAYLEDRVVRAHRTGALIELKKWVRRNRALAATLLALVALSVGDSATAALVLGAKNEEVRAARDEALDAQRRAEAAAANEARQRALAEANAERALAAEQRALADAERASAAEAEARARAAELERVADFQAEQLGALDVEWMGVRLRRSLIEAAPEERRERLTRELEGLNFTSLALRALEENLFDRTIEAIDTNFAEQPLVRAQLLQSASDTLRELGLLEPAGDPLVRALAIRREELGDDHADTLDLVSNLGTLRLSQGRLAEAEGRLREALDGRRRLLGDDDPDTLLTLDGLGFLRLNQGRLDEAEALLRAALDERRRVLGADDPRTLTSLNNVGGLLQSRGELAEAERCFREALEGRRRVLGEEHPQTLISLNNMGGVLQGLLELEEAERCFRDAADGYRRVLGDEHPNTLAAIDNLANLLHSRGKLAEAEPFCREALEGRRRALGDEHPQTLVSFHNLGFLLHARGELEAALPWYVAAYEGQRRLLGDDHASTRWTRGHLRELHEERVQRELAAKGPAHRDALAARRDLALLLAEFDRAEEAEVRLQAILDERLALFGGADADTLESFRDLARCCARQGRAGEAEQLLRECLEGSRAALGEDHAVTLETLEELARLAASERRWDEARELTRQLLELTPEGARELAARELLLERVEREAGD